jgi:hypothetical protein
MFLAIHNLTFYNHWVPLRYSLKHQVAVLRILVFRLCFMSALVERPVSGHKSDRNM